MPQYEYKVVPAPAKGLRAKGVKGTEARFAHALMSLMNDLGREGWEYQRADTLPCEERAGFFGRTTRDRHMLIFRRAVPEAAARAAHGRDRHPVPDTPEAIAEAAAATLTADPAEEPPARRDGAPALGPARDGPGGGRRSSGYAAE